MKTPENTSGTEDTLLTSRKKETGLTLKIFKAWQGCCAAELKCNRLHRYFYPNIPIKNIKPVHKKT